MRHFYFCLRNAVILQSLKTGLDFFMFDSNEHGNYDAQNVKILTFISMMNITSESLKAIKDLFLSN